MSESNTNIKLFTKISLFKLYRRLTRFCLTKSHCGVTFMSYCGNFFWLFLDPKLLSVCLLYLIKNVRKYRSKNTTKSGRVTV